MTAATPIETTLVVVRSVEALVLFAVSAVLARRWWRHRDPSSAAALGLFLSLGVVIATAPYEPDRDSTVGVVIVKLTICLLLAFPYFLVRFAWALGGLSRARHRLAAVLYAVEVVATLVLPLGPLPGEPRPTSVLLYVVLLLGSWTVQSALAAIGLWARASVTSALVRRRLRALAAAGTMMTVALFGASFDPNATPGLLALVVSLVAFGSILLFVLAFLLPPWLRLLWRQPDIATLSTAERALLSATRPEDVARTIVPAIGEVMGTGSCALLRLDGSIVHSVGLTAADILHDDSLLTLALEHGSLVVRPGLHMPAFGPDENDLLARSGALVDLALQRAELFVASEASRARAEHANAELQTMIYSVSHDLRSPLISVLGYLEVLRREHADQLAGDGSHYLNRITVNAQYMQSLIRDLLELSRIGRSNEVLSAVDLGALVAEVTEAAALTHPRASLTSEPAMATVMASEVRLRQLVTNLVDNALAHGGREDLTVTVGCQPTDGGGVDLTVADDGRGVPERYREKVFAVFERLDRETEGTGMGLAICRRIVDGLEGQISIDAPTPAGGTLVRVGLPASAVVRTPVRSRA